MRGGWGEGGISSYLRGGLGEGRTRNVKTVPRLRSRNRLIKVEGGSCGLPSCQRGGRPDKPARTRDPAVDRLVARCVPVREGGRERGHPLSETARGSASRETRGLGLKSRPGRAEVDGGCGRGEAAAVPRAPFGPVPLLDVHCGTNRPRTVRKGDAADACRSRT